MARTTDFLIIGAGIAGASAAAELASHGTVVLLERESRPGYHSTGRSSALFTETYGNRVVRALSASSRQFFTETPAGFAEHPLLAPRGVMMIATPAQVPALDRQIDATREFSPDLTRLTGEEARSLAPILKPGHVAAASLEPQACDIDVDALHNGFLRRLTARGGRLVVDAEVTAIERAGAAWTVRTRAGAWAAGIVVNAAGAWADAVAGLAGATPVGLTPKRRTAILIAAPDLYAPEELARWPATVDADESFYFKPDAGRLLVSPADATPSEPCDAQPEDLDVATAVDRLTTAAEVTVERILHKRAGLRTFADDNTPVVGYDPKQSGFFWLAGQGGYGIQTSPAMARIADALVTGTEMPGDVAARGVTVGDLSPGRFAASGQMT